MDKMDILIPVKQSERNDELKYVLRSIEAYVPHRNIVIVGYKPEWLTNDKFMPHDLKGDKFTTVIHHIVHAAYDSTLSEAFILFHDDLFVLDKLYDLPLWNIGSLEQWIKERDQKVRPSKQYQVENAKRTLYILKQWLIQEPLNYALHVPRVLSKSGVRDTWHSYQEIYPETEPVLFNTLYHNRMQQKSTYHEDVKIHDAISIPDFDDQFVSTTDHSFAYGEVGKYIRSMFPNKSKYEL